ncbi:MAG: class I SAM-dependent methyltransferase [Pirellulales bacterium]
MIDHRWEDRRYSELYRRGYGPGPVGSLWKWSVDIGVSWQGADVLDCGCGRATLRLKTTDVRHYVGIDVAFFPLMANRRDRSKADTHYLQACSDRLPFADGCFSIAWCCDVLEHVPEQAVPQTLHELARVAKMLVLSISTRPSRILDADGANLHLTVRPSEWWQSQIMTVAKIANRRIGHDSLFVLARAAK